MAVGTVSGVNPDDAWQLISSVTPSGTSVTFSSLSGYKTILLAGKAVTKSGADTPVVRLNGDSSAGSYGGLISAGTYNSFIINASTASAQAFAFVVYNINQSVPHHVAVGYAAAGQNGSENSYYTDAVPITSITLLTDGGSNTFTGGTVYLYGIPA